MFRVIISHFLNSPTTGKQSRCIQSITNLQSTDISNENKGGDFFFRKSKTDESKEGLNLVLRIVPENYDKK